jgi:hypothetical protein
MEPETSFDVLGYATSLGVLDPSRFYRFTLNITLSDSTKVSLKDSWVRFPFEYIDVNLLSGEKRLPVPERGYKAPKWSFGKHNETKEVYACACDSVDDKLTINHFLYNNDYTSEAQSIMLFEITDIVLWESKKDRLLRKYGGLDYITLINGIIDDHDDIRNLYEKELHIFHSIFNYTPSIEGKFQFIETIEELFVQMHMFGGLYIQTKWCNDRGHLIPSKKDEWIKYVTDIVEQIVIDKTDVWLKCE